MGWWYYRYHDGAGCGCTGDGQVSHGWVYKDGVMGWHIEKELMVRDCTGTGMSIWGTIPEGGPVFTICHCCCHRVMEYEGPGPSGTMVWHPRGGCVQVFRDKGYGTSTRVEYGIRH